MKIYLFIFILISQTMASILTYPNGKKEQFILNKENNTKPKIYYKNGLISKRTSYIDTRKIYVSFGEKRDLIKFLKDYNLKLLKTTNKKLYTYLFKIKGDTDIIELCSKINKNEKIRYAKPNWKAPRYTK